MAKELIGVMNGSQGWDEHLALPLLGSCRPSPGDPHQQYSIELEWFEWAPRKEGWR